MGNFAFFEHDGFVDRFDQHLNSGVFAQTAGDWTWIGSELRMVGNQSAPLLSEAINFARASIIK